MTVRGGHPVQLVRFDRFLMAVFSRAAILVTYVNVVFYAAAFMVHVISSPQSRRHCISMLITTPQL